MGAARDSTGYITDQYGRPFPTAPRAPLDYTLVVARDGSPVPSGATSRREFLKTASGITLALSGVGTLLSGLSTAMSWSAWQHQRASDAAAVNPLRDVFPFLFEHPERVRFHPNADDRRLLDLGIGYADASVADHLHGHDGRLNVVYDGDIFAAQGGGHLDKADVDVYSYMTLLQAYALQAFITGEAVSAPTQTTRHQYVRQSFDPRVPNVIVGSPTGNRFAAAFRGKRRRPEADRRREMIHEGVFGLHLPFEFALDADADPGIRRGADYAWSVHVQRTPSSSRETLAPCARETCYLTATVLPNFLARGDARDLPPTLLLEGAGALGTSGIRLLWERAAPGKSGPLATLREHLRHGRSPYWQALFKVTETEDVPVPFGALGATQCHAKCVEFVAFEPIEVHENVFTYGQRLVPSALEESVRRLHRASV